LKDLGDEIHAIWDLWRSGLQECKDNWLFWKSDRTGKDVWTGLENPDFFVGQVPLTEDAYPERLVGSRISSSIGW